MTRQEFTRLFHDSMLISFIQKIDYIEERSELNDRKCENVALDELEFLCCQFIIVYIVHFFVCVRPN